MKVYYNSLPVQDFNCKWSSTRPDATFHVHTTSRHKPESAAACMRLLLPQVGQTTWAEEIGPCRRQPRQAPKIQTPSHLKQAFRALVRTNSKLVHLKTILNQRVTIKQIPAINFMDSEAFPLSPWRPPGFPEQFFIPQWGQTNCKMYRWATKMKTATYFCYLLFCYLNLAKNWQNVSFCY